MRSEPELNAHGGVGGNVECIRQADVDPKGEHPAVEVPGAGVAAVVAQQFLLAVAPLDDLPAASELAGKRVGGVVVASPHVLAVDVDRAAATNTGEVFGVIKPERGPGIDLNGRAVAEGVGTHARDHRSRFDDDISRVARTVVVEGERAGTFLTEHAVARPFPDAGQTNVVAIGVNRAIVDEHGNGNRKVAIGSQRTIGELQEVRRRTEPGGGGDDEGGPLLDEQAVADAVAAEDFDHVFRSVDFQPPPAGVRADVAGNGRWRRRGGVVLQQDEFVPRSEHQIARAGERTFDAGYFAIAGYIVRANEAVVENRACFLKSTLPIKATV